MSTDKGYEAKILKMVVNEYLNQTTFPTKESIKALEANPDGVVWELSTKIYKESGYKVELCLVRNIVDLQIADIKCQLEKLETDKKARAEREANLARKALAGILQEIGGEDASRANIFVKLRKIIGEVLSVDESKVTIHSHLSCNLGADGSDLLEIVMALEEEFDIEIPDSVAEDELDVDYPYSTATWWNMSSGSYYSSDGGGGPNCTVENFLNFICAKVSA